MQFNVLSSRCTLPSNLHAFQFHWKNNFLVNYEVIRVPLLSPCHRLQIKDLLEFLRGPNKWKSEGAKPGLWAGCSIASQFGFWMVSMVMCAVWWCACCVTRTPCDILPLWFVGIADLSSFLSMLLQFTLDTCLHKMLKVRPLGVPKHCHQERDVTWNFWKEEIMCASITCPAVWFLVHTDEFKFHLPVDDANQGVITFMVVRLRKTGPHVLVVVLFCQVVWHPPCENLWNPRMVCNTE